MRLDDLFEDESKQQEETWTSEIPTALIEAQEAEEAQREAERAARQPRANETVERSVAPATSLASAAGEGHPEFVACESEQRKFHHGKHGGRQFHLAAPNHVVLNHLTASSIKGGVLA